MKALIIIFIIVFIGEISARSFKVNASGSSLKKTEQAPRAKRQFGGFGQSSGQANANAFNQYQGPNGFGASNALAGAQSFHSQGPLGGFGASAANSGSQNFQVGPGGIQGSAGFAETQNYELPGGHHLAISLGGSFSENNGQGSGSNSNSITYT